MSLEKLLKSRKTRIITATSGRNSTHNFILGTPGNDEEIVVPVGVTVYTELGKKLGKILYTSNRYISTYEKNYDYFR